MLAPDLDFLELAQGAQAPVAQGGQDTLGEAVALDALSGGNAPDGAGP